MRFNVSSSMAPSSFGIGDDGAQIAQRHIGQLGEEHRLVGSAGPGQRAGGERPQLGQAAQQRGLAGARLAGDDQRVADLEAKIERLDELFPVGRANLDVVELDSAVLARRGRDLRQRSALFVGGHQAVETDDRRAVAGEEVVGVAEERQPVLDVAERLADWLIAPRVISPLKNLGNCNTYGSGTMSWPIDQFQPLKPSDPARYRL